MAAFVPACSRCLTRPSTSSSAFNLASLASALPSTSYVAPPTLHHHAPFSTSSVAAESRKRRTARLKRKSNLDQRILKVRMLDASKPDPVLGHQLGQEGEKIWSASELARIVLDKNAVWGVKEDRRGNLVPLSAAELSTTNPVDVAAAKDAKEYGGPARLNFGLDAKDRQLLFDDLPHVMVKDRILDSWNLGTLVRGTANAADVAAFDAEYEKVQQEERASTHTLARVLDLRNASGKGIQVENIRRIINHFGGPQQDTGSPEVQAAVLTYRIRNLYHHLQTNRHDNSNRRSMTSLTHSRAKILKYLKRKSPQRYHQILPRIGVDARAVEGEIVVPGKPRIARS
ncbi:hypothetical protein PaG_01063 [Moesziomyces aphidis]|uniref:Ribosomal protein S15 n=1 Tax=Moesziomyces aphidis TaxID=84754 RepID=W3VSR2_MOEAP|nr:hypothetical protein PaG_01063 [Moesziomyces aphidis]